MEKQNIPSLMSYVSALFLFLHSGEDEELGPPPTVDEAADALMTRLGFLLGEKIVSGEPRSHYHAQDDAQVNNQGLCCKLEH